MIRLSTLGSPELRAADGRSLRSVLAQPKRVALLAFLAIGAPRTFHRRDTLLGVFWPELDQERARHALRQALYVLRRALGADVLISRGDEEVAIDPDLLWCDVPAFEKAAAEERLEEALELYRGPLLEGFFLSDAPVFEKWLDVERDRLRRLAGETAGRLASREAESGDLRAAIGWAQRATEHCPEDEAALRRLLALLDRAGDRAGAIHTYERFADRLKGELGVEPSPETQRAADEIRARETARAGFAASEPSGADLRGAPAEADIPVAARRPDPADPRQAYPHASRETSRTSPRSLVAALALLLVGAGWAGWTLWPGGTSEAVRAADSSPALDPTRVAVLYFDDHSETGELTHLANGLTEALIHELTQVSELDVVSRSGVKLFRDTDVPLDSIVRALKAGSLVEGSVQRSGDRLRVTVQLVDGTTNTHLKSATLNRPLGELFELQDDLVREVADQLRRRLGTEIRLRSRRAGTRSAEAWELVQRAEALREDAHALGSAGSIPAAVRHIERADSLLILAEDADPNWAEPIILRGWLALDRSSLQANVPGAGDREWLLRGIEHAERALRRDSGDAAALELRGTLRFRMSTLRGTDEPELWSERAEADLRATLTEEPSRAGAWVTLSRLLTRRTAHTEARIAVERALEADPFLEEASSITFQLHQTSLELKDLEGSLHWCREGQRRFPEKPWPFGCALFTLALPGAPPPQVAEAWTLFDRVTELSDPVNRVRDRAVGGLWVAAVLARAGLADSARAVAARARQDTSRLLQPWLDYYEANVRLQLDEPDEALKLLSAHLDQLPGRRIEVQSDWLFEALWSDPRFQQLVRTD